MQRYCVTVLWFMGYVGLPDTCLRYMPFDLCCKVRAAWFKKSRESAAFSHLNSPAHLLRRPPPRSCQSRLHGVHACRTTHAPRRYCSMTLVYSGGTSYTCVGRWNQGSAVA